MRLDHRLRDPAAARVGALSLGAVALTFDISGAIQDEKMEIFRRFFILKSQYLKIRMNAFVRSMN